MTDTGVSEALKQVRRAKETWRIKRWALLICGSILAVLGALLPRLYPQLPEGLPVEAVTTNIAITAVNAKFTVLVGLVAVCTAIARWRGNPQWTLISAFAERLDLDS